MKIETPILRRLGPVPLWRGETRCLDALERIYRRAAAYAESLRKTVQNSASRPESL